MSVFEELIDHTGLPKELISKELTEQLEKKGLSPNSLSLDDLRVVLSEYLQDVILEAKKNFSE